MPELDASKGWLGDGTETPIAVTDNKVENPDSKYVWDLNVSGDQVILTDSKGQKIMPKAAATNGIMEGKYTWIFVEESVGIFTINSTAEDAVILASNKTLNSGDNKFRAYKVGTVSGAPSTYFSKFTLYKLDDGIPSGPVKTATPQASKPSGVVASGSAITLSCTTTDASIQYRATTVSPSAIWVDYIEPIIINSDTRIEAKATAPEYLESDIVVFNYVLAKEPEVDPGLFDPIPVIPEGAISVLEASQLSSGQVTVVGQLVYRYGNYNAVNTAILEDVINGQIYALQIFNALSDYKIGDVVKLTGTMGEYGGVPQLSNPSKIEVLTPAANTQLIPAQKFTSFNELMAVKDSLLSEWVVIKDVTLGTYSSSASTKVTDSNGVSMDIYRAATYPIGVTAGEKVDLYACVSKHTTTDQLRVGYSTDYVISNDMKAPIITLPTFEKAELGKDYKISITITDNVAVSDADLTYTVNQVPTKVALAQSAADSTKWEVTIPGSTFTAGVSSYTVLVTARDKAGNEATSSVIMISVVDEPQVTKVTPERNGKIVDEKRPLISIAAINLGLAPTAKLTLKSGETVTLNAVNMSYSGETFSYTPSKDLADARYTASVVITRADGKAITYEWPFTVGTPKYSLYFGQLHSHTTYSDGSGSLDEALNYINKISKGDNIDFVAFTDHSNYFDKSGAANPEASLYNKSLMTAESQKIWNEYKNKIADFNASSTNRGVIALGGFEMTWSGGPGHMNTWNTEGIVSRNNTILNNKTNDAGMKAYYTLLSQPEGANSVSQFNHPGKTFGTFSDFAYWDPTIDSRITLLEVGNGEGAIGSGGYFPSYNYYTMALDKGWHVAPTNNQDNHKGKWGNGNDARDVIITDNFTEQGIYDALKARKVYATEDKNLEITYTVNDELMGSIIKEVPKSLDLKVTLSDADDIIQKAEVIANSGRIVHTWDVNAQSKELSVTLSPEYSYYYIRVTEKDGDLAVTAPVWIGNAKVFGISNVESDTIIPVTDEPMTVKTTLFNSESTDITIKSMAYSLDGKIIDLKTSVGTVAKGTTQVINYSFKPTKAKVQTLNVEVVMTLDGIDYSFTKDLSLDVRDANKLVYIGIDGSHFNEYVAGNYKDSMGNFGKLAAESNVRCVVLNTSEQLLEAAKNENGKYKMLILTAPSRRDGTKLRNPYLNYSAGEIAAIKGFSEAGGSLVLCGWSDLYENYGAFPAEDHMAAQQNKLLEAVGASLRISDDGAYDDVLNAGGSEANKARLYLSTYNWENPFTQGIEFDKDNPNDNMHSQLFSQYGGGTIHVVDKNGNATSTLPENISPIVWGHSTTYSKDCDNDHLGGSAIPKYEYAQGDNRLMVLASETVTHANGTQSLVIVDGAAFMSNFEIQATLDNTVEKNYSNYTILQNLIQYANPTQIDKIADVQKEAEEGVKFSVEGIVTSNASGYDKPTAFFDCIYLQDETAGINAFPVAGDFKVGQKVRITGTSSSYQGERQLNVSSISLVDSNITKIEPKEVTAKQINDRTYLGSLVKISGKVTKVELENGAVQTILVQDNAGNTARIFIDGYITTDKEIIDLVVGSLITAVGLSSYDNTFDGLAARIRIRDRGDIVCKRDDTPTPTSTPTPTPTTTPTPTPKPEGQTVITVDKAEVTIVGGKANVKIIISEEVLKDVVKNGNKNITISLGKEVLKDIISNSQVKKGIVIDLSIPSVKDANVNNIVLSKDTLLLAKKSGQKLTINVAFGKGYTVDIPVSELKKVAFVSKDLNIAVTLKKDTKAAAKSVGILSVGTEGKLTTGMVVTVPVKGTLSLSADKKVYIYHKNAKTGALEEMPNNPRTVAADGTIKLSTLSGGDFVICTAKVKDAVTLVDRVKVTVESTVAKGEKINVKVALPQELARVTAFTKGDPVGQEEVKVTYKVSDKNIATVSSNGTITAKKKGTIKLTVVITLENGEKKNFNKTIKVN
ncbi:CehA/McbA family metallohydrolase [Lachnoclostridium phytofermentans]|uniref:Nucleic acid binding OB-fold tRNA/helicase-type n=1 Tax=Lachnoclostridium phytofermentans (strain ATCC 700394 / DSM 18823 / ISDg) TaxID=357809 RepID=A9KN34_LACP7|nr:CehA/McbA family metallohydrolase [Lachnoclostridium phytofermentans]ABX41533.1 nucleic acid binding OB-fold tRNA/helicase-type [Lachnoclostridium phytofermentans ISDg]